MKSVGGNTPSSSPIPHPTSVPGLFLHGTLLTLATTLSVQPAARTHNPQALLGHWPNAACACEACPRLACLLADHCASTNSQSCSPVWSPGKIPQPKKDIAAVSAVQGCVYLFVYLPPVNTTQHLPSVYHCENILPGLEKSYIFTLDLLSDMVLLTQHTETLTVQG